MLLALHFTTVTDSAEFRTSVALRLASLITRSLVGGPLGPVDFVLRALQELRPGGLRR